MKECKGKTQKSMYCTCGQEPWKVFSSLCTRLRIQPECVPLLALPPTAVEASLQARSWSLNEYWRQLASVAQASAQAIREGSIPGGKMKSMPDRLSQSASKERDSLWMYRR